MVIVYSILAVHDRREKKKEREFRTKFDERWSKYFEGGRLIKVVKNLEELHGLKHENGSVIRYKKNSDGFEFVVIEFDGDSVWCKSVDNIIENDYQFINVLKLLGFEFEWINIKNDGGNNG